MLAFDISINRVIFYTGDNTFKNLTHADSKGFDVGSLGSNSVSPQNLSPLSSPVNTCPIPLLTMKNPEVTVRDSLVLAINFLMDSYNRVSVEERNQPKRSSIPPLSDVLTELRAQIIHHTTLIVQGFVIEASVNDNSKSHIFNSILQQSIPRGFLTELVTRTHTNERVFSNVFSPILQSLFKMMQSASIVGDEHRLPLQTLFELVDIRCGSRPICTLISKQIQFSPAVCTPAQGREITRTSFLGPFLCVSVFAEDEPKVGYNLFILEIL